MMAIPYNLDKYYIRYEGAYLGHNGIIRFELKKFKLLVLPSDYVLVSLDDPVFMPEVYREYKTILLYHAGCIEEGRDILTKAGYLWKEHFE